MPTTITRTPLDLKKKNELKFCRLADRIPRRPFGVYTLQLCNVYIVFFLYVLDSELVYHALALLEQNNLALQKW